MEKLEIVKVFFKNENFELDKYVFRCFLIIELGNSIFCEVKELDDLYDCMEENSHSNEERNIPKIFQVINQLIFEYGQKNYDYDKWLEDNPESENWLNIIEEYMILSTNFKNNPIQWYKEIQKKMEDNKFKTK